MEPRTSVTPTSSLPECGIVMPISAIDGCSAEHWKDVLAILKEAIGEAGFQPNLVSDADDIGVIQKRIIQNLYTCPILVCDVSGKNPNVMFELGMRLAFDKPTIIVKDTVTGYSFDTAPVEHLTYPRDLRYQRMQEFKRVLSDKLRATYERATADAGYSTFLKEFGSFKAATLDEEELPAFAFLTDTIQELRRELKQIVVRSTVDASSPLGLSSVDAVRLMEEAYTALPPQVFAMDGDVDVAAKRLEIAEILRASLMQDRAVVPLSTVLEFVNQKMP